MPRDLDKLHEYQLAVALEVKRICDRYNIRYFLIAGTLLGAVRHAGFIPWDDDIDIGMLREDYNKFIELCKSELSPKYFLQTMDTDEGYGLPFAKLRINGTKYLQDSSTNTSAHDGICLDVFPFDNVPSSLFSRLFHMASTYTLKRLLLLKGGYTLCTSDASVLKRTAYRLITVVIPFLPRGFLVSAIECHMIKYNSSKSDFIVVIGGSYGYLKETVKRQWFERLVEMSFDGHSFSCPAGYHEYLSHLYGDYMTPPPESKRHGHSVIEICFGDEGE